MLLLSYCANAISVHIHVPTLHTHRHMHAGTHVHTRASSCPLRLVLSSAIAAMVIDGSSPSSSVIRHLSFQCHHFHVPVHSIHPHAYVYICMCAPVDTHTHTRACMHSHMPICMRAYKHVPIYVHIRYMTCILSRMKHAISFPQWLPLSIRSHVHPIS